MRFMSRLGSTCFSKVLGLAWRAIDFVIKWFHKRAHWNFKDFSPECTDLIGGIIRQFFWTLFNEVRLMVWISELQINKLRRSWGIRLLQYSYASFSCCNLMTSWILSIFRSMNKGLAWLSKSEKVIILTHFFWSFTILSRFSSVEVPHMLHP